MNRLTSTHMEQTKMQTKITPAHTQRGAQKDRPRQQGPALVSGGLAFLSLALILIYSSSFRSPTQQGLITLATASPTQPLSSSSAASTLGASTSSFGASSSAATASTAPQEPKGIFKRSFAGLGCLGVYDKAKFARLDRVCEECYTLYREPDIHSSCRQDCFRNSVFTRCVDALLLSHEAKKFDEMVDELYGK